MSSILYNIIITPIETIIDWVWLFLTRKISSTTGGGILAVAGVSIAMNFMALPIYNVADRIQEKQRKIAKSLEERVRRIKKTFKGDYIIKRMHPLFRKKFNSIVSSKLYDEIRFINEISQLYYLTNVTILPITT